jgi:hypothetical protein
MIWGQDGNPRRGAEDILCVRLEIPTPWLTGSSHHAPALVCEIHVGGPGDVTLTSDKVTGSFYQLAK